MSQADPYPLGGGPYGCFPPPRSMLGYLARERREDARRGALEILARIGEEIRAGRLAVVPHDGPVPPIAHWVWGDPKLVFLRARDASSFLRETPSAIGYLLKRAGLLVHPRANGRPSRKAWVGHAEVYGWIVEAATIGIPPRSRAPGEFSLFGGVGSFEIPDDFDRSLFVYLKPRKGRRPLRPA